MYGVCRNHCSDAAASGVVGSASIMPVFRPGRMSVAASATGWKPSLFQACTMRSSPAHENIFVFLRSASEATGCLLKKYTQPPCPQLSRTKPFCSRRCLRIGCILSST